VPNRRLTYVIRRDGIIARAHQAELSIASHGEVLEDALAALG